MEDTINKLRRSLEKSRQRHCDLEQAISWLRGRVKYLEKEKGCEICGGSGWGINWSGAPVECPKCT